MSAKKGLFWDFVRWVQPSFEGNDRTASYRRFTAFGLAILNAYLIIADKLEIADRINAYYANLIAISLIIGIVTAQNILDLLNRGKTPKEEEKQERQPENPADHGIDSQ